MSETEIINDTEFIEVIDIDDRIIKLEKNHPLYYTEDNYEEFLGEKLFKNTDDLLKEIRSTR
jgi:hypothetical protein